MNETQRPAGKDAPILRMGGVDWRDDEAVITFARKFHALLDGA